MKQKTEIPQKNTKRDKRYIFVKINKSDKPLGRVIKKGKKAQTEIFWNKKRTSPWMMQRLKRKFRNIINNILPMYMLAKMDTFLKSTNSQQSYEKVENLNDLIIRIQNIK